MRRADVGGNGGVICCSVSLIVLGENEMYNCHVREIAAHSGTVSIDRDSEVGLEAAIA